MHIKSILALLLSLVFAFSFLFSFFPSTIRADELPNKIEEVLTLFELDDKTDVHSFNEVGVDFSRASNDDFNDSVYESSRNERLVFDSQGDLKSLSRTHLMTNQSNEIVQSFTTINSFDSIISNLISADYIPADFYLSNYHKYYEDLWVLIFSKQEANGVNNPYNIVKIGFDAVTAEILFFNRINDFTGTIDPIISEDQAIELAQKYISEIGLSANVANYSELTIVRTSDFTLETDFRLDEYISVYKVFLTNKEGCVWVDSASGNILLIEKPEIYDARALYTYDRTNVYDDRYRKTRADNYNDIMSFSKYFRRAIKTYPNNTILANVYKANELIPDNDTYWVRYVGDRTTTGHK